MVDFNEYSQKGSTLMQQALKKLAEGDVDAFEKNRKEANRYFDLFYAEVNSESGKMTQLYGESRNFGIIYNVIEQNMVGDPKKDTKLRKLVKEMYGIIKNDKVLNEEFKIYDFFEKSNNVGDAKTFVNETVSLIKKLDKKQVKESNEKLIKFIRLNKLDEYVEIPENLEKLYEAIEYVILNKKSFDNAVKFIDAQNIIAEHIEKSQDNNINENRLDNKTLFNMFDESLQKEQEKIEETINDDERNLLEEFMNPKTDKQRLFENYKSQTLSKIDNVIKTSTESDKHEWQAIYETIKSKAYSEKLSENLITCAEMLEICGTIDE